MSQQSTEVALVHSQNLSIYATPQSFENAQRMCKSLIASDLVPDTYKGKMENALIAYELSTRMQVSPLMVMQNLNIIKGKPSFGSQFLMAMINACGQFSPLEFEYSGEGDKKTCRAHAIRINSGKVVFGPPCSIQMAKAEGWYSKPGSKWPNMPEMMLMYRAGAFFQRMYAPELSMGIPTAEEVIDITPLGGTASSVTDLNQKIQQNKQGNLKTSAKPAHQMVPIQEIKPSNESPALNDHAPEPNEEEPLI